MWQALHAELEPLGLTVVTVALDFDPEQAREWIEAASPTHPSLIDSDHRIDALLGICNVPMAVWIDEDGHLVRPAEGASIKASAVHQIESTDGFPERMQVAIRELQAMPDSGEAYRAAIVDWAHNGADSRFALAPHQVIDKSQPRPAAHSQAAAVFEIGKHLYETVGKDAAIPWWKKAHELHPENWTYKRQAWTLESTPEGGQSDKAQEVGDVYGTSWLDEVLKMGGGANYVVAPDL